MSEQAVWAWALNVLENPIGEVFQSLYRQFECEVSK